MAQNPGNDGAGDTWRLTTPPQRPIVGPQDRGDGHGFLRGRRILGVGGAGNMPRFLRPVAPEPRGNAPHPPRFPRQPTPPGSRPVRPVGRGSGPEPPMNVQDDRNPEAGEDDQRPHSAAVSAEVVPARRQQQRRPEAASSKGKEPGARNNN